MRILLVGALSWNPERIRSLHERGHSLWGLWTRSMGWDQGPYSVLSDCVRQIALEDAVATIRAERIDCVYSLFQVYHPRLWGPSRQGAEHDVWTVLRTLLAARDRGEIDIPIVRHWGFDVQNIDVGVARALDGQIFCNEEKLGYWTLPVRRGGCGVSLLAEGACTDFFDSDRPKLSFMNDDFPERLSSKTGEVHTVCIGRPFGIDYLAAARRGIHVHVYGNRFDDIYKTMARDLGVSTARREAGLLRRYLHVHPSLQSGDGSWEEVEKRKATWVREFAQYDAAWSYIGSPFPWDPLDDRGAIPNRVSTYLLAGLPVISDRRPGFYRYGELVRLGVNLDLDDKGYDGLRGRLDDEVRTGERRQNAIRERAGYSFDALIEPLIGFLGRTCETYFSRPVGQRTRFAARRRIVHFTTSPDPVTHARSLLRRLVARPDDVAPAETGVRAVGSALLAQLRKPVTAMRAKRLGKYFMP